MCILLISSSLFEANFIKRADFDFIIKIDIKNDNLAKEKKIVENRFEKLRVYIQKASYDNLAIIVRERDTFGTKS